VVVEGGLQGEDFHLHEGRNIIGSSPPCEIRLQDEGVEDRHASIRFSSNQWILTDLDSENGTFLNGKRIYRHELKDGDKIIIGKSLLRVKTL
jgi:pSer/pThr/pTyr-binding forkhead associated (FHA) protein